MNTLIKTLLCKTHPAVALDGLAPEGVAPGLFRVEATAAIVKSTAWIEVSQTSLDASCSVKKNIKKKIN